MQFELFLALDNPAGDIRIDRIDELAFLEHLLRDRLRPRRVRGSPRSPSSLRSCRRVSGQKAQLLAQDVIEPANLVCIGNIQIGRQIRDPALTFVPEPGCRRYLFPDVADDRFINLDLVFQRVECVLQLLDELVGQIWPSRRKARGLQIGDGTDPVPRAFIATRYTFHQGDFAFSCFVFSCWNFSPYAILPAMNFGN